MQQVFYIHGGESFSDYDTYLNHLKARDIRDLPSAEQKIKWTHHLRQDLGDAYEVFMPQMPNAHNARYEEWKIWFERHFEYLNDGLVLIGCSLGAMFLVKYLSENETPFSIKLLVLMAAPVRSEDLGEEDCGSFVADMHKIPKLAERAEKIEIWHSKDDFVVPFSHGEELHTAIPDSKFVIFEDKNHFLVEELPELIACIKTVG